ncbi:MAG: aldo/keto reductase [Dorea sp.]|nr:aldo/keto reductase [Dorea sp.]
MSEKKLGFGLMRLPLTNPFDKTSIDVEMTQRLVDTYLERGFNYFDTALTYCGGKSEEIVKIVLADRYPRDKFLLATKLHCKFLESKADRDKVFYAQLSRCGVEYFDYYLLQEVNEVNYWTYEKLNCFEWLEEKKNQGIVKNIGITFHGHADLLDKILEAHPEIEVVQLRVNYYDWNSKEVQARACYEVATKHNKPVLVMEPVKGGLLVNVAKSVENILDAVRPDMSIPSWAVRFAASLDNVKLVLSGMDDMESIIDNTDFMMDFEPLNEEEEKAIQFVVDMIDYENTMI